MRGTSQVRLVIPRASDRQNYDGQNRELLAASFQLLLNTATSGYKLSKNSEDETSQLNRLRFYLGKTGTKAPEFAVWPQTGSLSRVPGRSPALSLRFHHALSKFYGQAEWAISI